MLIVDARESESIDRALKKYKKKFEKAGILRQLRERQTFTKPSVRRRNTILRAAFIQQLKQEAEG
ncbi:MAG TPA: 30S ribosomal protein S21 [Chitinophagales bacterium]|nr:30S ribosomal protein S21 [Chitinophagales bacterium]